MSNSEEMKFEALAQLINNNHEENKQRMKDLYGFMDIRFNGLEEHNRKQNGSIQKTMERVANLEEESQRRGLTCMKMVETLEQQTRYAKIVHWIDDNPKKSIIAIIIIIFFSTAIIHLAIENGWMFKLWQLIVK